MTRAEAQKAIDDIRGEAADLPEMSLDEINAEIRMARAERKTVTSVDTVFQPCYSETGNVTDVYETQNRIW